MTATARPTRPARTTLSTQQAYAILCLLAVAIPVVIIPVVLFLAKAMLLLAGLVVLALAGGSHRAPRRRR